jgi:hypothetical protein
VVSNGFITVSGLQLGLPAPAPLPLPPALVAVTMPAEKALTWIQPAYLPLVTSPLRLPPRSKIELPQ